MSDERRERRPHRPLLYVIAACLLVIAIWLAASWSWYRHALTPVSTSNQVTKVTIARGDTVRDVGDSLAKAGIIRSERAFLLYDRLHRSTLPILAGTYALRPSMSVQTVLDRIAHGDVVSDAISVTIPEGFDLEDIAAKLQQNGICSAKSFISAAQHDKFSETFLKELNGRKNVRYRLEGFLFPDTYDFTRHEPPDEVIGEMLDDFSSRVLTSANLSAMKKDGLSLNEAITEASLVENEAKVDSERPIIASVIDNRLRANMKLQIDVTVDYAIGHHLTVVTDADIQDAKGPYNTYLVSGLPPGPIGSPGLKSIEAVLHPAKTDYLYYVAKGDGSGEDYFAHTYAEQLHNELLREENLSKGGQ